MSSDCDPTPSSETMDRTASSSSDKDVTALTEGADSTPNDADGTASDLLHQILKGKQSDINEVGNDHGVGDETARNQSGEDEKLEIMQEKTKEQLPDKQQTVTSDEYLDKEAIDCKRPHKCQYCGHSFQWRRDHQDHERLHTGECPYFCEVCQKGLTSLKLQRRHEARHRQEPFKCKYCGKLYKTESSFLKHNLTHEMNNETLVQSSSDLESNALSGDIDKPGAAVLDGDANKVDEEDSLADGDGVMKTSSLDESPKTPLGEKSDDQGGDDDHDDDETCSNWSEEAENRKLRKQRTKRKHGKGMQQLPSKGNKSDAEKKPYKCSHCDRAFSEKRKVKKHEHTHTVKTYSCHICSRPYASKQGLKRHRHLIHSSGFTVVTHTCQYCKKEYKSKLGFLLHVRAHELTFSDSAKNNICKICNLHFQTSEGLKEHRKTHKPGDAFKCQYCSKSFRSIWQRDQHCKSHKIWGSSENSMCCDLCNWQFDSIEKLQLHVNNHKPGDPFHCRFCSKTFTSALTRQEHHRYHARPRVKPHACKQCGVRFSSKSACESHENNHKGERPFKCGICEKTFTASYHWRRHEMSHNRSKGHQCSYCGKLFNGYSVLLIHERIHTGERPYLCHHCGRTFRSKNKCNAHIAVNHNRDRNRFKCGVCGKGFYYKKKLKDHAICHLEGKPFQCQYCDKAYSHKSDTQEHEKDHFREHPFSCGYCGKQILNRKAWVRHERRHRVHQIITKSKPQPVECEFCGFVCVTLSGMTRHQRVHTGEKPYQCRFCERSFAGSGDRKKHERIHTGERPYSCKYCGKRFARSTSKRSHEQIMHETIKPRYECQHCGKVYRIKLHHENHERSHSVIKQKQRFPCEQCDKDYVTMYALNRHQRSHSGEKPYQCKYCNKEFIRKDYRDDHQKKACPLKVE